MFLGFSTRYSTRCSKIPVQLLRSHCGPCLQISSGLWGQRAHRGTGSLHLCYVISEQRRGAGPSCTGTEERLTSKAVRKNVLCFHRWQRGNGENKFPSVKAQFFCWGFRRCPEWPRHHSEPSQCISAMKPWLGILHHGIATWRQTNWESICTRGTLQPTSLPF